MIDIPPSVRDELEDTSEDELEFIEREIFLAYDEAYQDYKKNDMRINGDIAMYERALDTIRAIRNMKNTMTDKQIEQAKEIHGSINDT
jgi:hypothetical protein